MRRLRISIVLAGLTVAGHPFAASEMEERASISSSAQRAFLQDDFAQLEETSRAYRTERNRTPSGVWKLSVFYAGINNGIGRLVETSEREAAFRQIEDKTSRWAQRYPDSPAPHIALSMAHITHAWLYRGSSYAAQVKPENWEPFHRYVALARKNLEAHKPVAAADPRWYETMLTVARAQGWERDEFNNLLTEALNREPAFYQTYFLALEYLLPKWHGGTAEIEEFARDAVRRTQKDEGQGMYARIYWWASQTQFRNKLFTESRAVWPSMRSGFEDVIARYPDAWNLNNYAKFACLARDKPKTRELIARIEAAIVIEAWQPRSTLESCTAWAKE